MLITTHHVCIVAAAEVPRPSGAGLRPLSTGGRQSGSNAGGDGSEQQGSGLPPGMIDFLSREMEECLSPLGEHFYRQLLDEWCDFRSCAVPLRIPLPIHFRCDE